MATIKVVKTASNLIEAGTADVLGFTITTAASDGQFNFLANIEMRTDDGTYSEAEIAIVNNFIALVNSRLLS